MSDRAIRCPQPGDWAVDEGGTRVLWVTSPHTRTPQHPDFVVAQCSTYCGQGGDTLTYEQACYHARLVSAIPEMLAALELNEKFDAENCQTGKIHYRDVEQARTLALKKVRGES